MPERMAAEGVARQQKDVHDQDQRADADAEMLRSRRIGEPHGVPGVPRKDEDEPDREIEEVAVDVLEDEREVAFAKVGLARLADGAIDRGEPERFIIEIG